MRYNSTKTIYGIDLILAMLKNERYVPYLNTTLNEKFSILSDEIVPDGEYPTLKYMGIGNGGTVTSFNPLKTALHKVTDAALFNQIPFLIKPIDSDITLEEQLKYRFRKETTINGEEYVEYYLKVMNDVESRTSIFKVDVNGDKAIPTEYNFNDNNVLNPTPSEITNITEDVTSFISKTAKISLTLSIDEVQDIKDAITLKYGSDASFNITELALCSGYDVTNNSSLEAIWVQPTYFVPMDYDIQQVLLDGRTVVKNVDIGGMEPLILN